ncbi:sensory box/GGDEF domain/EAL domain protein [Fulvimarina pelagi HTCC2506]|uniref:Sensory box/GGDEF domain/EAL domain protein n=2 Tax=Fulvimarina pelagi TaxID=217511 RepID=Q0G175_9HYPH|nr:EAL domain-containing protein [Fulvimarina pelagi]EAU41206.1 sensory box/GGDEF domain/EAL domain protein [Fulvimarina pelagi HTCC2506]BAT30783.1 sensory box/GGDEF domain/EAL domain protein [Fulvimarina pelagi]
MTGGEYRRRFLRHTRENVRAFLSSCLVLFAALASLAALTLPAHALDVVAVSPNESVIDLRPAIEVYRNAGRSFQVSAVPGPEGIVRRIEIDATTQQANGDWAVFALTNESDEQIDRLIVAPHFTPAGSGVLNPDLGSQRIAAITPSQGFALERQVSSEADEFLVTLDPGAIVTFVAELTAERLPDVRLWEPGTYRENVNAFTLYRGIVLGIAGLLAVFLTILFVVKGSAMFPAAAALSWSVLAYICIDFQFWEKLMPFAPGQEPLWRAGVEVAFLFTLILFLFAYLSLNRWHGYLTIVSGVVLAAVGAIGAYTLVDPVSAAGITRVSLAFTAALGLAAIISLSIQRFDRAVMLLPTWLLLIVWIWAAWMTVTGRISNDIIQPALGGSLVLIVLLIGFTVMQHGFAGGTLAQGLVSDLERRSLALAGSGDAVFDWDVIRDRIFIDSESAMLSALPVDAMNGPARNWLPVLHPDDRDRFKLTLDTIIEHRRGRMHQDFRVRDGDGHYHWLALRARPMLGTDGEVMRCVGTLKDITSAKKAEDRLLQDAMVDQLTGLPNREVFMDRLEAINTLAAHSEGISPTVFVIDIDRFKQVNDDYGLATGDTILLTIGRRLKRTLKPQDTLARLSGDQFGAILVSETSSDAVASFAEHMREAIRAPIAFAERDIVLTASIGLTGWSSDQTPPEALTEADLAMHQAKRMGGDRIEPFRPAYKAIGSNRVALETDLRRAFERHELALAFQPIVALEDETIAGFEALLRWDHPRRGKISPAEFVPLAERSGLIVQLGQFALEEAAKRLSDWHRATGDTKLFMSVNVSSRQLITQDLIADVDTVLQRYRLPASALKLEMTESLVMDNPERSAQLLDRIVERGVGLSLDDFGTGYSSLAYLMRFPFDTLKIDQSFLKHNSQPQRPVILKSIVTMAHDLGLKIVAEGVETEADVATLRQMKCEYAQSFLYAKPLNQEEARRMLVAKEPGLRRTA